MIAPVLLALLAQAGPLPREALERHVRFLASDELEGRAPGSAGGRRAADYVAARFKDAGLKPAGRDGWFHDFSVRATEGRNVLGLLVGKDPGRVVVLAAHHDHRGIVAGKIQNGADDDASGVAVLIEAARGLAGSVHAFSLLFASFDAEERGLLGSREFLKSGLVPPERIAALVVLDLVGGRFFKHEADRVFIVGSESSSADVERAVSACAKRHGLDPLHASAALLEPYPGMARSDYGPFRDRKIPFLFLSTGTPWYYHTEHDDPEVIDFPKLARVGGLTRDLVADLVAGRLSPEWAPRDVLARDLAAVRVQIESALALKPGDEDRAALEGFRTSLGAASSIKDLQAAMVRILGVARRGEGK